MATGYTSLATLTPGKKRTRQQLEMDSEFSLQQFIISSGSISNADSDELSELNNDFSSDTFAIETSLLGESFKRRNLGESQNLDNSRLQPVDILSDY